MPKAGIRFGGNAYFKKLLADEKGKLTMAKQFLAGLGAGATGDIIYSFFNSFNDLKPSKPCYRGCFRRFDVNCCCFIEV